MTKRAENLCFREQPVGARLRGEFISLSLPSRSAESRAVSRASREPASRVKGFIEPEGARKRNMSGTEDEILSVSKRFL